MARNLRTVLIEKTSALEAALALALWRRHSRVEFGSGSIVRARRVRLASNSTLLVGAGSLVNAYIVTERSGALVQVGCGTYLGASTISSATSVTIGARVQLAWGAAIVDHDSHSTDYLQRRPDVGNWLRGEKDWTHVACCPVVIEDDAWIGLHAIILKGVTIGARSIVGAGAVVTRDVPPDCIVAGNPARVIRRLDLGERVHETRIPGPKD